MGIHTLGHIASALKSNTSLRRLSLWDGTGQRGLPAFAEVLAVNTCLEKLIFLGGQVVNLDLLAFAGRAAAEPHVGSTGVAGAGPDPGRASAFD